MGLFLSTYVNKVDKKGRVSIPAPFRATLAAGQAGAVEMVVFPSLQAQALEAAPYSYLEKLAESLETANVPHEERDLIDTAVFGRSVPLTLDPEGRVILPEHLLNYAGITESISFVGTRNTFHMWDPALFEQHEKATRELARANKISLSNIMATAKSLSKGA